MALALVVWLVMTVFPALKAVAAFGTASCLAILLFSTLFGFIEGEWEPTKIIWKRLRWILPLVLLLNLVPSKETSWYMLGAYATQTIAQSDTAHELASDGVDVLRSLIKKSKEYIDAESVDVPKEIIKGEKS